MRQAVVIGTLKLHPPFPVGNLLRGMVLSVSSCPVLVLYDLLKEHFRSVIPRAFQFGNFRIAARKVHPEFPYFQCLISVIPEFYGMVSIDFRVTKPVIAGGRLFQRPAQW